MRAMQRQQLGIQEFLIVESDNLLVIELNLGFGMFRVIVINIEVREDYLEHGRLIFFEIIIILTLTQEAMIMVHQFDFISQLFMSFSFIDGIHNFMITINICILIQEEINPMNELR